MGRAFTLLLRENGTAELLGPDGGQRWASDSDEDFLEQWDGDTFLGEDDVEEILNYLEDVGELTARQAAACIIEEDAFVDDEAAEESGADEPGE